VDVSPLVTFGSLNAVDAPLRRRQLSQTVLQ